MANNCFNRVYLKKKYLDLLVRYNEAEDEKIVDFSILVPIPKGLELGNNVYLGAIPPSNFSAELYLMVSDPDRIKFNNYSKLDKQDFDELLNKYKRYETLFLENMTDDKLADYISDDLYNRGKLLIENLFKYGTWKFEIWASNYWGCKWNADTIGIYENDEDVQLEFNTPWGPPSLIMSGLFDRCKESLTWYYEIEGYDEFIKVTYQNGEIIEENAEDPNSLMEDVFEQPNLYFNLPYELQTNVEFLESLINEISLDDILEDLAKCDNFINTLNNNINLKRKMLNYYNDFSDMVGNKLNLKTIRYVDIKYPDKKIIYTYICPDNIDLKTGEYIQVSSRKGVSTVEVIKGTYECLEKFDFDYLELPIVNNNVVNVEKKVECNKDEEDNQVNNFEHEGVIPLDSDIFGKVKSDFDNFSKTFEELELNLKKIEKESFENLKKQAINNVRECGALLQYVDQIFRKDRDVVAIAVKSNGMALKYASSELRKDPDIVLLALKDNPSCLQFAADSLKNDEAFMLKAIEIDKYSYRFASKELRNDKKFTIMAACNYGIYLEYASEDVRNDKETMIAVLKGSGTGYMDISESLKNDRDVALAALETSGGVFRYFGDLLRKDRELFMKSLDSTDSADFLYFTESLKYCSDDLRNDREVVLKAISKNVKSFKYASKELRDNFDFVSFAIEINRYALEFASAKMKKNKELIAKANLNN